MQGHLEGATPVGSMALGSVFSTHRWCLQGRAEPSVCMYIPHGTACMRVVHSCLQRAPACLMCMDAVAAVLGTMSFGGSKKVKAPVGRDDKLVSVCQTSTHACGIRSHCSLCGQGGAN